MDRSTRVPSFARLPLTLEAAPLLAEARTIGANGWVAHFNASYHDGGWQGAALRSVGGDATTLHHDPARTEDLRDTDLLSRCPRIAAALARFECPLQAVRLLRLAAGGVIREHRDHDLRFEDGEARLHVPLATNPEVEFYVDGERVIMEAGECWYLDLSRPHRVQNRGATDRIHLVIDCRVNEWLTAQIAAAVPVERAARTASGAECFAAFRELVLGEEALQAQLRAVGEPAAFVAKAVELGSARGLRFGEEDVRAAMTRGRQAWHSQWVL
jgi:mannose-6-phosphate isomerase-like protein (cupin superfamily)